MRFRNIRLWNLAVRGARRILGLHGFVPVGGKSFFGKMLYMKAKIVRVEIAKHRLSKALIAPRAPLPLEIVFEQGFLS